MSDSHLIIGAHEGGTKLVSPTGKQTRILTIAAWKKILRMMKEARAEGFVAHFSCEHCQQPIRMTVPNKTSPRLECGCTMWMGRTL